MHPKILTLFLLVATAGRCATALAITPAEIETLLPALIQVESGGRDTAVGDGGKAVGCLQLWPVMVQDVNRISGKRYTLADRLDRNKSKEMARIYFRYYGKRWTVEQAARAWNGGVKSGTLRSRSTDGYWKKVKKELAR